MLIEYLYIDNARESESEPEIFCESEPVNDVQQLHIILGVEYFLDDCPILIRKSGLFPVAHYRHQYLVSAHNLEILHLIPLLEQLVIVSQSPLNELHYVKRTFYQQCLIAALQIPLQRRIVLVRIKTT